MLSNASLYTDNHQVQARDARHLVATVLLLMDWSRECEDVVMDVGCGPGDTTRDVLLPAFPDVKAVVAMDVLPKMVNFAKKESRHPKISYHVADIGDRSTLKAWQGGISKIVSIYCLQWVKDHRKAFENILYLLKPGGEAAILFASSTALWDCIPELVAIPKWNALLRDVDPCIPDCYYYDRRPDHYRTMLEKTGFTVLCCQEERRTFTYLSDEDCKVAVSIICALTKHVPDQLVQEFAEDLFRVFVRHNGRAEDGRSRLKVTAMTLLFKKPLRGPTGDEII